MQKRIRDSLRIFINLGHLEQLLYLDEKLYNVKWEWSYNKRGYDLMIGIEGKGDGGRDKRKNKVREVMMEFLKDRHLEFLENLKKNNNK